MRGTERFVMIYPIEKRSRGCLVVTHIKVISLSIYDQQLRLKEEAIGDSRECDAKGACRLHGCDTISLRSRGRYPLLLVSSIFKDEFTLAEWGQQDKERRMHRCVVRTHLWLASLTTGSVTRLRVFPVNE